MTTVSSVWIYTNCEMMICKLHVALLYSPTWPIPCLDGRLHAGTTAVGGDSVGRSGIPAAASFVNRNRENHLYIHVVISIHLCKGDAFVITFLRCGGLQRQCWYKSGCTWHFVLWQGWPCQCLCNCKRQLHQNETVNAYSTVQCC